MHYLLKRKVLVVLFLLFLGAGISSAVFGQIALPPLRPIGDFISRTFQSSNASFQQQPAWRVNLNTQWSAFTRETSFQLGRMLNQAKRAFQYSATNKKLTLLSKKIAKDMTTHPQNRSQPVTSPLIRNINKMTGRQMNQLAMKAKRYLPDLTAPTADGNPLGNMTVLFKEAEHRNPLGLGAAFKMDPAPFRAHGVIRTEQVETIVAGTITRMRAISAESQFERP